MKLILDNIEITEEFFSDTRLIGIVAPLSYYTFCWQLNFMLGYRFTCNVDIERQVRKKNRDYYFSVFQHDENAFLRFYVFHNHCDGEYLLPEFHHMDFLLLLKGDYVDDVRYSSIIASIKSAPSVQLAMELSIDKVKNKERLVF